MLTVAGGWRLCSELQPTQEQDIQFVMHDIFVHLRLLENSKWVRESACWAFIRCARSSSHLEPFRTGVRIWRGPRDLAFHSMGVVHDGIWYIVEIDIALSYPCN